MNPSTKISPVIWRNVAATSQAFASDSRYSPVGQRIQMAIDAVHACHERGASIRSGPSRRSPHANRMCGASWTGGLLTKASTTLHRTDLRLDGEGHSITRNNYDPASFIRSQLMIKFALRFKGLLFNHRNDNDINRYELMKTLRSRLLQIARRPLKQVSCTEYVANQIAVPFHRRENDGPQRAAIHVMLCQISRFGFSGSLACFAGSS